VLQRSRQQGSRHNATAFDFLAPLFRPLSKRHDESARAPSKEMRIADARLSWPPNRSQAEEAYAGDILGRHNPRHHQHGDSLSEWRGVLPFTGVPNFARTYSAAPCLKDQLRMKARGKRPRFQALRRGARTQCPFPLRNRGSDLGAVGQLRSKVVAFRLQDEYECAMRVDTSRLYGRAGDGGDRSKLEDV